MKKILLITIIVILLFNSMSLLAQEQEYLNLENVEDWEKLTTEDLQKIQDYNDERVMWDLIDQSKVPVDRIEEVPSDKINTQEISNEHRRKLVEGKLFSEIRKKYSSADTSSIINAYVRENYDDFANIENFDVNVKIDSKGMITNEGSKITSSLDLNKLKEKSPEIPKNIKLNYDGTIEIEYPGHFLLSGEKIDIPTDMQGEIIFSLSEDKGDDFGRYEKRSKNTINTGLEDVELINGKITFKDGVIKSLDGRAVIKGMEVKTEFDTAIFFDDAFQPYDNKEILGQHEGDFIKFTKREQFIGETSIKDLVVIKGNNIEIINNKFSSSYVIDGGGITIDNGDLRFLIDEGKIVYEAPRDSLNKLFNIEAINIDKSGLNNYALLKDGRILGGNIVSRSRERFSDLVKDVRAKYDSSAPIRKSLGFGVAIESAEDGAKLEFREVNNVARSYIKPGLMEELSVVGIGGNSEVIKIINENIGIIALNNDEVNKVLESIKDPSVRKTFSEVLSNGNNKINTFDNADIEIKKDQAGQYFLFTSTIVKGEKILLKQTILRNSNDVQLFLDFSRKKARNLEEK